MPHFYLSFSVAIIISYLMGSVSSAIITCKILGLPDPRTLGSRNPGATNVLRIGGKKAAIITLLGDMLKGFIPVLLAKWYGFTGTGLIIIAFAAFMGHLYPIFFRFEGGKGVATMVGCLIAFSWKIGLAVVGIWLIIAGIFRYASLAAIVMAVLAPFFTWYFVSRDTAIIVAFMSILLIYRHRENIRNLLTKRKKEEF